MSIQNEDPNLLTTSHSPQRAVIPKLAETSLLDPEGKLGCDEQDLSFFETIKTFQSACSMEQRIKVFRIITGLALVVLILLSIIAFAITHSIEKRSTRVFAPKSSAEASADVEAASPLVVEE